MRSLDSSCGECTDACSLPKQGREGRLKTSYVAAAFPSLSRRVAQPEPSERSSPAGFTMQLHSGARAAKAKERPQL